MYDAVYTPGDKSCDVESVARKVHEISTLPEVALRIIQLVNDPRSNVQDLVDVIANDPALSSRVLRTVNAAAHGVKITRLPQAISLLGFRRVRNLATTALVASMFKRPGNVGPYNRATLWKHMVSVALAARLIARAAGRTDFEDAFLAGLLHDIGIILEDQYVHRRFKHLMLQLAEGVPLPTQERNALGFTHTMLGERIADKWKFPAFIRSSIAHHHNAEACLAAGKDIVRCVEAGNIICTVKGITSVGYRLVTHRPEVFEHLGFSKHDLTILSRNLDDEISENEHLFETRTASPTIT